MTISTKEFLDLANVVASYGTRQEIDREEQNVVYNLDGVVLVGMTREIDGEDHFVALSVRVGFEDGTILMATPDGFIYPLRVDPDDETNLLDEKFQDKRQERDATLAIRQTTRELEQSYSKGTLSWNDSELIRF